MTLYRANRRGPFLYLALAVLVLAACDGGAVDQGPSLAEIPDQATTLGEQVIVPLTVTHANPAEVVVAASSSDGAVVPDSAIAIAGAGANRTITITPSNTTAGTARITVVAVDSQSRAATEEFDLVVEVPFAGKDQVLEPSEADAIGVAVAIDGGVAVSTGIDYAYVFQYTGGAWQELAKLLRPSENGVGPANGFGEAVAIAGGYVLVGAPEANDTYDEQGSATVFERDGDTYVRRMQVHDQAPEMGDHMGDSVGLSGEYLFAGAPGASEAGYDSGSVVLFGPDDVEGWSLFAKLTPRELDESDDEQKAEKDANGDVNDARVFGDALDVAGELVVVGDYGDVKRGADAGAAYVFEVVSGFWQQTARLVPDELEAGDQFGISVAGDGAWVLVGAWNDDDAADDAGAVYVYKKTGSDWVQVDKLFASDASAFSGFGSGVALSYPYAAVAAMLDDEAGNNAGAVYVFRHDGDTWHELVKLTSPQPSADSQFGWDVDISGDFIIASQFGDALTVIFQRQ